MASTWKLRCKRPMRSKVHLTRYNTTNGGAGVRQGEQIERKYAMTTAHSDPSRYLLSEQDSPGGHLREDLGTARTQMLHAGPLGFGVVLSMLRFRYRRNRTAIEEWLNRLLANDTDPWKDSDAEIGREITAVTKPRREKPQKWIMLDSITYTQGEETDDTEMQEIAKPRMTKPTAGSPYYWPTTYLHSRIGSRTFENVAL
jgi:hypothetical protein